MGKMKYSRKKAAEESAEEKAVRAARDLRSKRRKQAIKEGRRREIACPSCGKKGGLGRPDFQEGELRGISCYYCDFYKKLETKADRDLFT